MDSRSMTVPLMGVRSKVRAVLAAVVAGLLAACSVACSGGSTGDSEAAAKSKALAAYNRCHDTWEPFITKLNNLNSRLDVGLTQGDYNNALGTARIAYDHATSKMHSMTPACLAVGAQLEDAFNAYIAANRRWSSCINQTYCTPRASMLQPHWTTASNDVDKAKALLAKIKLPPKTAPTRTP